MPPHPYAPGELEFVRAFVNTRDIDQGTDRFATPEGWAEWATGHGIRDRATDQELSEARALREILRDGLLANHDGGPPPVSVIEALTRFARRTTQIVITDHGVELAANVEGSGAVIGRVVSAASAALSDGSWSRLKACGYDSCRWAFYDHSRSRTGRWCSMELCGNRAKQARWRAKQPH